MNLALPHTFRRMHFPIRQQASWAAAPPNPQVPQSAIDSQTHPLVHSSTRPAQWSQQEYASIPKYPASHDQTIIQAKIASPAERGLSWPPL